YVVGGNQPAAQIEGPAIEEVPWPADFPEKDDFDSAELNSHFQTLRIPLGEEIVSLTDNPGHLRLYGRESLTSKFTQAFVARRWQHFNFIAETKVAFQPTTFQQAAGLACYYNTENWTILQLTWDEAKGRILDLMACDNFNFSQPLQGREIPVPEGVEYVYMRVTVRTHTYRFSYSFDGERWEEIPIDFPSYKLSDDYVRGRGFFTGAFVGMHCRDITGSGKPADF